MPGGLEYPLAAVTAKRYPLIHVVFVLRSECALQTRQQPIDQLGYAAFAHAQRLRQVAGRASASS